MIPTCVCLCACVGYGLEGLLYTTGSAFYFSKSLIHDLYAIGISGCIFFFFFFFITGTLDWPSRVSTQAIDRIPQRAT